MSKANAAFWLGVEFAIGFGVVALMGGIAVLQTVKGLREPTRNNRSRAVAETTGVSAGGAAARSGDHRRVWN